MKPKLLLCLALVLCGVFSRCVSGVRADDLATNAEPRYLDKSLSEWIPLAMYLGGDIPFQRDPAAYKAVLEIGANALPWLLQWIRSEKPETAELGVEGFEQLGQIAEPAIPELIQVINDWPSSSAWRNAIPALASIRDSNSVPYAAPFLLSAAANATAPAAFRLQAAHSSLIGGAETEAVIRVFVLLLKDKDWQVAANAADELGRCYLEPLVVVPALADCLASRTNAPAPSDAGKAKDGPPNWRGDVVVRYSAVQALAYLSDIYYAGSRRYPQVVPAYLPQIREAMRAAAPALVQALSDEDMRVAMNAARALGGGAVEPNLAVPALIKSLDHPQRDVQRSAAAALGNLGQAAQSAVPALTKIAQADPHGYVGFFAETALAKIGPQAKP
jgi:HEAT repeat protein